MTVHDLDPVNRYNLLNFEASFRTYLSAVIKLKPVSIKNYLSDIRHFDGWLAAHAFISSLDMITHQTLEDYKNYLQKNSLPSKTINRRLSSVRKFFSFLVDQGHLQVNPSKGISNTLTRRIKPTQEAHPTSEVLNAFEAELKLQGLVDSSVTRHVMNIQEFFSIINSSNTYGYVN
jgi:integrase